MPPEPIEPTEQIDKDPQAEVVDDQTSSAQPEVLASPAVKTEADETLGKTRQRLEAMEEDEKLRPLRNSIYALHQNNKPTENFRTIIDLLENKRIKKQDKPPVINVLLLMIADEFGVIGDTRDSKKGWIDTEWLHNFYKMCQEYLKYFEGMVSEEWRTQMFTRIAAECLKPFDISEPEDKEPTWRARRFSERIDLAEEINKTVPVQNLEQGIQKGIGVIGRILRANTSIDYYEQSTGESRDRYDISTLARKYGIALPSRKETWEKKIKEEMDSVDESIREKEKELEKDNEVGDLRRVEESIQRLEKLLEEASRKIKGLTLPEGASSIQDVIANFRERLSKISTQNILRRIRYHVKSLEQALESGSQDRIDRNIRDFLSTASFTDQQVVNVEEIIVTLEEMRYKERTRITDLAAEISSDPTMAHKKGEELIIRGKVLTKISEAITDFSKLRPKVVLTQGS